MLEQIQIDQVLFIDLETVSAYSQYSQLPERLQNHWKRKARFIMRQLEDPEDEDAAATYRERAAIYAEFGKIVCISIGYVHPQTKELRLKSFCSADEKQLLSDFSALIEKHYNDPRRHFICGHNIKEFDIPYLCRRMVILGLPLPAVFQLAGKKPWETNHLVDTLTLWKFGDIKHFTSLDLLAAILGIETPKDDIDGSMVGQVFWEEKDLNRIAIYCEKDVVTVAQVLLRMKGLPLIPSESIVSV